MSEQAIKELHALLTNSILRAEQCEFEVAAAYREVAQYEVKLAELIPITHMEGITARRGAVCAAFKARDPELGRKLAHQYREEAGPARRHTWNQLLAECQREFEAR